MAVWALVADRSAARIVERRGVASPLEVVEEISHPQGHLRDRDVGTDAPGRTRDRAGYAHHALEPGELPHEHDAVQFASALAEKLRHARLEHRFDRLVLAAEPRFLGILRAALDAPTRRMVVAEVPKHLLGAGDGELAEQLADALRH